MTYVCLFILLGVILLAERSLALRQIGSLSRVLRCNTSLLSGKTPLVANGKRIEFEPGTKMLEACTKLGLKVPLDCRKGQCNICMVNVGGVKIRACCGKVPPVPKLKSVLEKGLQVTVENSQGV